MEYLKNVIFSWSNRHSFHIDVTGQVSSTKTFVQRIIDSIKGIKDESEVVQEAINNNLKIFYYTTSDDYYSIYMSKTFPDFVLIKDKNNYLKERGSYILRYISNKGGLPIGEEDHSRYLLRKYIPKEIIKHAIKKYFEEIGKEIYFKIKGIEYFNQRSARLDLLFGILNNINAKQKLNKKIFLYCIKNGIYTKEEISEILNELALGETLEQYLQKQNGIGDLVEEYYEYLIGN